MPEGAASHLKTAGSYYRHKKLDSLPENWEAIIELIDHPDLLGVVVKLNTHDYSLVVSEAYEHVGPRLLTSLSKVRHVIYVHETTLTGRYPDTPGPAAARFGDDDEYDAYIRQYYFAPPPEETRVAVNRLLDEHELNVVPYRTNAQVSVLAAAFVEDNEKNLLFRLYVPAGRIYAAEAERLLSLFRTWITEVQGERVRQDGYRTRSGQVFEFFGVERLTSKELLAQFGDFSRFLEQCVEDPEAVTRVLSGHGVDPFVADDIVRRYGKETKRLQLDIRQTRESRLLSIRHRLESELVDVAEVGTAAWSEVERLVDSLVPTDVSATLTPAIARQTGEVSRPVNVTIINQQTIDSVYGTVIQGLQGTANLGIEARQLMQAIQEFGGPETPALQSDALELEDPDARPADRLGAKQRLKGFLFKLTGRIEDTALGVMQKYIESKVGLGPPDGG